MKLNIIETDETSAKPAKLTLREKETAKFERLWLTNPEQFNPYRNCMEKNRLMRTLAFIEKNSSLPGKRVVDLGSGFGALARLLTAKGAIVDAVDISQLALDHLKDTPIKTYRDYVPRTKLPDDTYDIVIGADLIAYLDAAEFRLFMSEMARLSKPDGLIICSTPLDINSDDALGRFAALSETEFLIHDWCHSYHRFWIRLHDFFAAPDRFVHAANNPDYRNQKLAMREGFSRTWFQLNSASPLRYVNALFRTLFAPLNNWITNSDRLLLLLESLARSLSPIRSINHTIWAGKRRPILNPTPTDEEPIFRKGKREVWE